MPAIGPGVSQALFSPGHQCRSTEVISQDCSSRVPGPTVVAVEAAQILAWSNPRVYVPTKPTAAKARPVSATGALVHLDVPQLLSLQCRQRGCKSVVPAASRRDFSSSSLVALPLGLSCGFSPTSVCVPPTGICSSGCPRAHAATQASYTQTKDWFALAKQSQQTVSTFSLPSCVFHNKIGSPVISSVSESFIFDDGVHPRTEKGPSTTTRLISKFEEDGPFNLKFVFPPTRAPRFCVTHSPSTKHASAELKFWHLRQEKPRKDVDPFPQMATLLPLRPKSCIPQIPEMQKEESRLSQLSKSPKKPPRVKTAIQKPWKSESLNPVSSKDDVIKKG
ncbi:hypothetical protein J1605_007697 [Eschrichtius robustus]|uniref:Uncharacterized protein n=1 Tax=Eschrichtius robustus TaxID=9764 RepID=A0AB34GQH6_ESCRO|nr:hypothetical protein J1605_011421 [Eschrichtius robustus]KAJ8784854.1 hypothetical protein J1605_007881 [Eschrichtius robustus]KAJ8785141.1 hypothetical protein J1605_007697 [Eschrichtius robustus]